MADEDHSRAIRSYGRTRSRTIKPAQAQRMSALFPKVGLSAARPLGADVLGSGSVWLEIGFGGGEHLAGQAAARPDAVFLGAEPFQNGVASCLGHIEQLRLNNVRVFMGDARELLQQIPSARLEGVYLLFPDPWPKARHQKRRLLTAEFAAVLADRLADGGRLRFATDWGDYAEQGLKCLLEQPELAWAARRATDFTSSPRDHVPTRYEAKGLGDIKPLFFDFIRRAREAGPAKRRL